MPEFEEAEEAADDRGCDDAPYEPAQPSSWPSRSPRKVRLQQKLVQRKLMSLDIPLIDQICRFSFTEAVRAHSEEVIFHAHQRWHQDKAVREESRKKAAAWKRRTLQRRARELRRQEKEKKEEEERREQERVRQRQLEELAAAAAKRMAEASDGKGMASLKLKRGIMRVKQMNNLGKVCKAVHEERVSQKQFGLQIRFEALPEDEQQLLRKVFSTYDLDGSQMLEKDELRNALMEVGLKGLNPTERRMLSALCKEKANGKEGCNFLEFAADLVPAVRHKLLSHRQAELQKIVDGSRRDWEGRLAFSQFHESVRDFLPVELLDDEDENEDRLEIAARVRNQAQSFIENESIGTLGNFLMRMAEDGQRRICASQRQVQQQQRLNEGTFHKFRTDLLQLNRVWVHVDTDGSGSLDYQEVLQVFTELGLIPKSTQERRQVEEILSAVKKRPQTYFTGFLELVVRLREMVGAQGDTELKSTFDRYTQRYTQKFAVETRRVEEPANLFSALGIRVEEEERKISSATLRQVLEEVRVLPKQEPPTHSGIQKRSHESIMFAEVVQAMDPEGLDEFSYDEVKTVCQRLRELARSRAVEDEARRIRSLRFSDEELNQLGEAFNRLDADGGGTLDEEEIGKALKLLGVSLSEVQLRIAFHALDDDSSGALELGEFLLLIRMVQDKTGALKLGSSPISKLTEADESDLLHILSAAKVPWESICKLDKRELIECTATVLGIGASTSLYAALEVSTLEDVLQHCERNIRRSTRS